MRPAMPRERSCHTPATPRERTCHKHEARHGPGTHGSRHASAARDQVRLNVAIVVTTDVGQPVGARHDQRPRLTDFLPATAPIAQAADGVLLIYHDEARHFRSTLPGIAEIEVARNRYGPCGTLRLGFDGTCALQYARCGRGLLETSKRLTREPANLRGQRISKSWLNELLERDPLPAQHLSEQAVSDVGASVAWP